MIEVLDGFDVTLMAKVYGDVKRLFYQANKCDDVERVGLQIVEESRFGTADVFLYILHRPA